MYFLSRSWGTHLQRKSSTITHCTIIIIYFDYFGVITITIGLTFSLVPDHGVVHSIPMLYLSSVL